MTSMTITTDLELAFWISEGDIQVFVGDDADPSDSIDLRELVRLELMSHALPASAETVDEIDATSIDGREALHKLYNELAGAAEMVFETLRKTA